MRPHRAVILADLPSPLPSSSHHRWSTSLSSLQSFSVKSTKTRTAQFFTVATNLAVQRDHIVSWIYRWSQVLLQPYKACTTNVETSKFDSLVSRHLVGLPCCYCSNICCSACRRRGYSCLCSYNSRVYRSFAPASVATRTMSNMICVWCGFMMYSHTFHVSTYCSVSVVSAILVDYRYYN